MRKLGLIIAVLFLFSLTSCNSSQSSDTENSDSLKLVNEETMNVDSSKIILDSDENKELGKEYTAAYICPDHCKGSGSDSEGECSNCGMELMENPNYQEEK